MKINRYLEVFQVMILIRKIDLELHKSLPLTCERNLPAAAERPQLPLRLRMRRLNGVCHLEWIKHRRDRFQKVARP